jgi:hypothetical protein
MLKTIMVSNSNDNIEKRPRKRMTNKLTRCIIEGHYYKSIDTNKDLPKGQYYVKCQRCGDIRIIHDKGNGL